MINKNNYYFGMKYSIIEFFSIDFKKSSSKLNFLSLDIISRDKFFPLLFDKIVTFK